MEMRKMAKKGKFLSGKLRSPLHRPCITLTLSTKVKVLRCFVVRDAWCVMREC